MYNKDKKVDMEITIKTTRGTKLQAVITEKNTGTFTINGCKFGLSDIDTKVVYSINATEANNFMKSINVNRKTDSVKMELDYDEFKKLEKLVKRESKVNQMIDERIEKLTQKAKETGKPQLIGENSYETSGNYIQVVVTQKWIMPDGTTQTTKEETH